ncbi:MAG: carbamoyl-phosphate synthase large subunit, partial [Deltaproteobacteria bacterium]|nr:carbamoyl-phosphate synthase large subunit [Deltaproteobacteria bacterium]
MKKPIGSVLIIGSGPIVIGQACEFDYSGCQALKVLREEGVRTILCNSNPATIMTDPGFADRTYVVPLTPEAVTGVIELEKPDALLPTLGGQTALNLTMALHEDGTLDRLGIEVIGASVEAIQRAESREDFRDIMNEIGLKVPRSEVVRSMEEARSAADSIGFPLVLRPSFTLGGSGGEVAWNQAEFEALVARAIEESPTSEVLLEQSLLGFKEFELEVMRDHADNVVIVCSIENIDPMGIHTGDSITVAPAQTLTDREYQKMRDGAIAIIRAIGVDTGGSNIQFAVDPKNGDQYVIEMNPRVSRSSALASKATGYPIAKVATLLAIGKTLDEIPNAITGVTTAAFEPTLDYVAVKVPYFAFERFHNARPVLSTQMRSVGEAMALGRTFGAALEKAMRSLETDGIGLGSGLFDTILPRPGRNDTWGLDALFRALHTATPSRIFAVADALRLGMDHGEISQLTGYDPWFVREIEDIVRLEMKLRDHGLATLSNGLLKEAKRAGFSDRKVAMLVACTPDEVVKARRTGEIRPVFNRVDTCAAEFEALTPYLYSSYESECEAAPTNGRKVAVIGSGPNRIGQGIEFDYCCVHAVMAAREAGFESIMVNCNPETVSTDYDTSDRLYFEPLTDEDVDEILRLERPEGVVVQFGGQTPLNIADALERGGHHILGTGVDAIDRAEDRERFNEVVERLGLRMPASGLARSQALAVAGVIGYPVLARPSYVLGGRAMEILYREADLKKYIREAVNVSNERPVLIDRYLEDAIEVDVDALCDGHDVYVAGVMEHVEEAGVHSGDSACCVPPHTLKPPVVKEVVRQVVALARELGVVGLMNCQLAVKEGTVYVLEANPRASRTVPYVSKATGVSLAKLAMRVMLGEKLADLNLRHKGTGGLFAVKFPVFPFAKFRDVDPRLGPQMRSTGEVMGLGPTFASAYLAAALGAGLRVPDGGKVFLSVRDEHKKVVANVARRYLDLGFKLAATAGTAACLEAAGMPCERVSKVTEGSPNAVDMLKDQELDLIVNTPRGASSHRDSAVIRRTAL